jgi:hypothetical protein
MSILCAPARGPVRQFWRGSREQGSFVGKRQRSGWSGEDLHRFRVPRLPGSFKYGIACQDLMSFSARKQQLRPPRCGPCYCCLPSDAPDRFGTTEAVPVRARNNRVDRPYRPDRADHQRAAAFAPNPGRVAKVSPAMEGDPVSITWGSPASAGADGLAGNASGAPQTMGMSTACA